MNPPHEFLHDGEGGGQNSSRSSQQLLIFYFHSTRLTMRAVGSVAFCDHSGAKLTLRFERIPRHSSKSGLISLQQSFHLWMPVPADINFPNAHTRTYIRIACQEEGEGKKNTASSAFLLIFVFGVGERVSYQARSKGSAYPLAASAGFGQIKHDVRTEPGLAKSGETVGKQIIQQNQPC